MKARWIAGILLTAITISACDDDTANIGYTLTKDVDHFAIVTDTFNVQTRSILIDSVLSQNSTCYLGRIKDPITGDYITSDYTSQFVQLESLASTLFPDKENMVSRDQDDNLIADSCHINVYIVSSVGDSLAPMGLKVQEMKIPVAEGQFYYTDFSPEEDELIRTDGIMKQKTYTFVDFLKTEELRNTTNYIPYINIPINDPYTDKNGTTWSNYGSYIINSYYDHPEYFKNSFTFTQNVCPGFYFKSTDGAGLMSQIYTTELKVFYRYYGDTVTVGNRTFTGTTEVKQTTTITNDKKRLQQLVADNSCTYLKTPSGIFTEVELPVEDIMRGHEHDSITSAKIVFQTYQANTDISFDNASYLVMVPKAKMFSFFEDNELPDNRTSYLAQLSKKTDSYEFGNISTLVTQLYKNRAANDADWNKVVLIPVECTLGSTTTTTSTSATTATKVSNLMYLTNTRLVGGSENTHAPVTISVIYTTSDE